MPSARFWRIIGLSTWSGGDLELTELHLHNASGRVDDAAALTCSHSPIDGSLASLKDGSLATKCRFAGPDVRSSGFWLQWDFGLGASHDVVALNVGSSSSKAVFPEIMSVESSDSGAFWTPAFTVEGIQWPGANAMTLVRPKDSTGGLWTEFGVAASTIDPAKLVWTSSGYMGSTARAGKSVQSGKWYWELTVNQMNTTSGAAGNALNFGVWPLSRPVSTYIYNTSGVYRAWQAALPGDVFSFAFDADAETLSVRRNGNVVGSALGQPLSMTEPWAPVIGDDNAGGAQVAANFGFTPFSFAPPAGYSALLSGGTGIGPRPIKTWIEFKAVSASAAVGNSRFAGTLPLLTARDAEFGGIGTIYGTTKTKGTPNLPTKARVVLLHQHSKLPVRETWSDPVTGYFEFRGIDTNQQFLTLAEDEAGNFRPVAANRLTPEVLV